VQRLVTLTGPYDYEGFPHAREQQQMIEISERVSHFKGLPDWKAGLMVLNGIGQLFPDLTWNDFRPENWPLTKKLINQDLKNMSMSGNCSGCAMAGKCGWNPSDWGSCIQNFASDTKDTIGEAVNWLGDSSGDAIRLITDEEVLDGASRIASAYLTYGGSEQIEALLGEGDAAALAKNLLTGIGSKSKDKIDKAALGGNLIPGIENKYLVYGGIGVGALVLLIVLIGAVRG
jgi:hypothetical protein